MLKSLKVKSKIILLAITLISTIIFTPTIDDFPLRNWDEAWYAEIIKNMASGNYSLFASYWNGQYYFDKPPLYFWLSLQFFKIFGPGEWQARIVSVLASIFASVLVFLIGKKLFGQNGALFTFIAFLTFGQVVVRFAHGNLDALLICLILASFYFHLLSKKDKRFAVACGLFVGLSFLAKGYLPGLYSLIIIFIYYLFTEKKLPKNLFLILTFALAPNISYYLAGYLRFGEQFINWYLFTPGAGLLQSPLSSFSLTYFKDFIRDIGLWWFLIAVAIVNKLKLTSYEKSTLIAFTVLIIIYTTPLNFLSEKLGWYNLPAYPLAALIVGLTASKINMKSAIFIISILLIILLQIVNAIRIENIHPDRSKVGANLGAIAKDIIPKDEKIILDDKDFTSFLFYSDHGQVFVSLPTGGKDWEWWTLKYKNLEKFIKDNPNTWLVTRDLKSLPIKTKGVIKAESEGYTFVRF